MITSNNKKGFGQILIFFRPFLDHLGSFLGPFWGMVCTLSAYMIIKVICLRPPLLTTTNTSAQASLWKETIKKRKFKKLNGVQKNTF